MSVGRSLVHAVGAPVSVMVGVWFSTACCEITWYAGEVAVYVYPTPSVARTCRYLAVSLLSVAV